MGATQQAEIDRWLRAGGLVVAASDRAARAIAAAFHRARRAEGLSAWPAPAIYPWKSFVEAAWAERTTDRRLLLNPAQELSLWETVLAAAPDPHLATLLEGPRRRLAALAMEARDLLGLYAPAFLRAASRADWHQDAAALSAWLTAFDRLCLDQDLLSPALLNLELLPILVSDSTPRPPLLLAGFDRILPTQRGLLDTWGQWSTLPLGPPATLVHFHQASDPQTELAACAIWCRQRLAPNPQARLLIVTQDAASRRGKIERTFLEHTGPLFEFSLGVPLSQIGLPKAALALLRWLTGELAEHELDWLFSTGFSSAAPPESAALQAAMRALRHRNRQQPSWSLAALLDAAAALPLPTEWVSRLTAAQLSLRDHQRRLQSPLAWSELVPQLLHTAGWPGFRPLASAEFQALDRFHTALDTCASLGFDGRRIPWNQFLSHLARCLDETLFAPESQDAPIQIAGPAESAGLHADAVWFLGVDEESWPAGGSAHPLLPIDLQRQAGMPHARPQVDWNLAHAITTRLLSSAPEVQFSYARQNQTAETRPSRLVASLAGLPQPLPSDLHPSPAPPPLTLVFLDSAPIPFPPGKVEGGAKVLTAQSNCPFQAFATARLNAAGWEAAQPFLTPSQRGQLLHTVLRNIWAGPPDGIRTLDDLQALPSRDAFVQNHVQRVFQQELSPALRRRLPNRYLEIEEQRLTRLVTQWLDYESARAPFQVLDTEQQRSIQLDGLTFDLRLDRLDRLNDGSVLVIDYKSGDVNPKSWESDRPEDLQLPLYACFALDPASEPLGGLVFAKLRIGQLEFAGSIGDARATLLPDLSARKALASNPLTAERILDWRDTIHSIARAFIQGRAEVDPRDPPKTCEPCGLQSLCRIQEIQPAPGSPDEDGDDATEASDE